MSVYAVQELRVRKELQDYFVKTKRWDIRAILGRAVIHTESIYDATSDELQRTVVSVVLPERLLDLLDIKSDRRAFRKMILLLALRQGVATIEFGYVEAVDVVLTVVPEAADEERTGLNNCFFTTDSIIEHDELRFRSEYEIPIYEELKKRDLLFFPNAAAILDGADHKKREPDFLICHKGKWGILEVMGNAFHKNAAKDHERARLFKKHGVLCVEFFTASECKWSPDKVVDKFLSILEKH